MKEVTYEDWIKNPTPRVMWVWDDNETCREKMKVLCISKQDVTYPVVTLDDDDDGRGINVYMHCAEIEEPKIRRMTNKELSRWLRGKPTREWKYKYSNSVHSFYDYVEEFDVKCRQEIVVREDDGEWREPLVEDNNNDND